MKMRYTAILHVIFRWKRDRPRFYAWFSDENAIYRNFIYTFLMETWYAAILHVIFRCKRDIPRFYAWFFDENAIYRDFMRAFPMKTRYTAILCVIFRWKRDMPRFYRCFSDENAIYTAILSICNFPRMCRACAAQCAVHSSYRKAIWQVVPITWKISHSHRFYTVRHTYLGKKTRRENNRTRGHYR